MPKMLAMTLLKRMSSMWFKNHRYKNTSSQTLQASLSKLSPKFGLFGRVTFSLQKYHGNTWSCLKDCKSWWWSDGHMGLFFSYGTWAPCTQMLVKGNIAKKERKPIGERKSNKTAMEWCGSWQI